MGLEWKRRDQNFKHAKLTIPAQHRLDHIADALGGIAQADLRVGAKAQLLFTPVDSVL